ncbi:MAG: hypothetical protein IPG04_17660 [Polyangiaceae bacterium]|nr:hypothetical protein [Polyangiaceae bacterium]
MALVPTTFFWSHRPGHLGLSPLDVVFGPTDMPGDLRAVAQFLVNFQNGAVRMADVVSARAFLEEDPDLGSSYGRVRRLTFALLRKVERERRAALGPMQKAPDRVRLEVLRSPRLAALIDDLSNHDAVERRKVEDKARRLLDGRLSAQPRHAARSSRSPTGLVSRVFSAVDVDPEESKGLREATRGAARWCLPATGPSTTSSSPTSSGKSLLRKAARSSRRLRR